MEEVVPGVLHWTAPHPDIGMQVSSYLLTGAKLAVDPLLPEGETPDWLGHPVEQVAVTICLHTRSVRQFDVPIRAPQVGVHRWAGTGIAAVPYDDAEELAPGVRAHLIGGIAPDDFALHIDTGPGVLAVGDALLHRGGVRFMPDSLMDEPDRVKRVTHERLGALLEDLEFDAVLFAHGEPIRSGGKAALRAFVDGAL